MHIVKRLVHVNLFNEVVVKEGFLYINLMYQPLVGDNIAEHDANGGRFCHKTKRVIEVNSWLLVIFFGNKSRLSSFKRTIILVFGF